MPGLKASTQKARTSGPAIVSRRLPDASQANRKTVDATTTRVRMPDPPEIPQRGRQDSTPSRDARMSTVDSRRSTELELLCVDLRSLQPAAEINVDRLPLR